jgi:hypothetical protein
MDTCGVLLPMGHRGIYQQRLCSLPHPSPVVPFTYQSSILDAVLELLLCGCVQVTGVNYRRASCKALQIAVGSLMGV